MNKIKKISNMLCIFIGICIFLLSYAHASLNKELSITGEAVVRADSDIRIINSERDVVENGAYEVYNNKYSVNTTTHFFNLPNCDSTITYKVTIQNNTNETYKLKDIITLNTTSDNIEYIVNNIETPDNRILKNTTINILITFKYKECLDTTDDINITLNYIFVKERGYLKVNEKNTSATSKFLETDLINNQINTISFVGYKDIPEDALGSYDVTDPNKLNEGDNVNLWYYKADGYTDTAPLYDVYMGSNGEVYITNGYSLFGNLSNLKQINFKDENGINRFNTTEATDMNAMFSNATALTSLDLSGFDTSKVTSMNDMFLSTGLTNLDLSSFNTSSVTSMNQMFYDCSSLTNVNLSSFNTSKVIDMSGMFYGCASLESIDLSNFNTSNLMYMPSMFNRCSKLTTLNLSNFNTSKVENMVSVFYECTSLTTLDLSNFNTSNVTNMMNMFYKCSSLTELNISNFDTSKVLNMSAMFQGCKLLTNLDLSSFNTSKVVAMSSMFNSCASLENLDLSNFNTSKVTNMQYMFAYMSKIKNINLSSFDTSSVTKMSNMFNGCSELLSLDLSNFNTINVTDMSCMFRYLSKVETLTLGQNFNTSKITDMAYMFQGLKNITELDLSGFDTSNVTSMKSMFYNCSKLKTIYASDNFVTTKVTSSGGMFLYSPNIVGGSGTTYNASYLDKTYARIDGGVDSPGYFTKKSN